MASVWSAKTFPARKRLPNPFSQTVDHSLSFFFPSFFLNKRWWRLPNFFHFFGKQLIYLDNLNILFSTSRHGPHCNSIRNMSRTSKINPPCIMENFIKFDSKHTRALNLPFFLNQDLHFRQSF